jgi:ABC-type spermidine/putrescine transport system permease subunit II
MILRWYQAMRRWENRNAAGFGGSFALGMLGFILPVCCSTLVTYFLWRLGFRFESELGLAIVLFGPSFAATIYLLLHDPKD